MQPSHRCQPAPGSPTHALSGSGRAPESRSRGQETHPLTRELQRWKRAALACATGVLGLISPGLVAQAPPPGFSSVTVGSNWSQPVGLTFAKDGRMFVWEKAGKVWIVENDEKAATPLLNITEEVGNWQDHGMLGFALDPNFTTNGYFYVSYVVDRHHLINFGKPSYVGVANDYFTATIGRIVRYQANAADGFRSLVAGSRKILLGETITTGIPVMTPTHGVGSLVFGADGTLLATCGEAGTAQSADVGSAPAPATSYAQALQDGIITAQQNVGSFRAQQVDVLSGKVLRLDPATGDGVPSNPYYQAANPRSPRSRVWALGLRNPFRMTKRPDTGSALPSAGNPGVFYLGDVGWSVWEELNVLRTPKTNFGWPAFQGLESNLEQQSGYVATKVPNPYVRNPFFGTNGCQQEFLNFTDLLGQATPNNGLSLPSPCNPNQRLPDSIPHFLHTRPVLEWRHNQVVARTGVFQNGQAATASVGAANSPVAGAQFKGQSSVAGVWYTGNTFPAQYQNTYFHGDYTGGWIKQIELDGFDNPVRVVNFIDTGAHVTAMAVHPLNGSLYYTHLGTSAPFEQEIRQVIYRANRVPLAVASADKTQGPAPLTVKFTGSKSSDPEGGVLTYAWDFGDNSAFSTAADPSHQFNAPPGVPTLYQVRLKVTDAQGLSATTTLNVSLSNTAPVVRITNPVRNTTYPLTSDTTFALAASVTDAEHGPGQLSYAWKTTLHHNDHVHDEPTDTLRNTFTTLAAVGCDGETYFYTVRLTVTDAAGLSGTDEVTLLPDCNLYLNVSALTATADTARVFVRWNKPPRDFEEVMVVAKADAGIQLKPTGDGSGYTADPDFRGPGAAFDGGKVVYRGRGTDQTVTGLTGGVRYFFRVFTRNVTTWSEGVETSAQPKQSEVVKPPQPPLITGTEEEVAGSVSVFPNPVQRELTLRVSGYGPVRLLRVSLYNRLGQPVVKREFVRNRSGSASSDLPLSVSELPRGIYLLQIQLGGAVVQQKVVVQ
ncbi:MAG: PQQ-dependent sugar dehydrogenase [Ferruginibacter sp.]|nr:PQQ-dependent sugar dehydrogenase [Cytophagales bacterium]